MRALKRFIHRVHSVVAFFLVEPANELTEEELDELVRMW
jgi:hypothetical protein